MSFISLVNFIRHAYYEHSQKRYPLYVSAIRDPCCPGSDDRATTYAQRASGPHPAANAHTKPLYSTLIEQFSQANEATTYVYRLCNYAT